jgi:hypothetical protein
VLSQKAKTYFWHVTGSRMNGSGGNAAANAMAANQLLTEAA